MKTSGQSTAAQGEQTMPVGARPLPNGMPSINSTTTFDELLTAVRAMPSTPPPDLLSPSSENPAVARCCQAYTQALKAAAAEDKASYEQRSDARRAYREAMPAPRRTGKYPELRRLRRPRHAHRGYRRRGRNAPPIRRPGRPYYGKSAPLRPRSAPPNQAYPP